MKKPDPSESKIQDIFSRFYPTESGVDELESLKENGSPLFRDEDAITLSKHPLDLLLKQVIKKMGITEEYFTEKYKDYALRVKGYHLLQTNNNKSNLLKACKAGKITWKRFLEMCRILGLRTKCYRFEFQTISGSPMSIELNDSSIKEEINEII